MMRPASDRDASIGDRSARLRLRVEQMFNTAQTAEMGYVARVRDVTPGRPKEERDSVSDVVVPVGGGGFHELAVRPGSYLIEAVTPAGSVLEADVEVGDGDTQDVNLADDTPSPHEWLGWQKVSGNLPGYSTAVVAANRRSAAPWPLIGAGLLLLVVLTVLAVGWFAMRPGSGAPAEAVNAQAESSEGATAEGAAPAPTAEASAPEETAPEDPASEIVAAPAPVPRRAIIARAPPGRAPAGLPEATFAPDRDLIDKRVRPGGGAPAEAAPVSPPPPEASGSGAPPPERLPTTAAPAPTATAAAPDSYALDESGGMPWWLWMGGLFAGLGLVALVRQFREYQRLSIDAYRKSHVPHHGRLSDILKSSIPEGAPMAPAAAAPEADAPAPAPPARLSLLTLPPGPGEWAMMLAALEGRAALAEAYAAGTGPDRQPQPEASDGQWSTYAALPLTGVGAGRPLWAIDNPATGRAEAVRLPEEWISPDSGQVCAIEILTAAEGREERASTAVRDPQYGTLLGYLAMGRLPEARALLGQAAEALFGKTINPYLAAAGGYVLIGSATTYDDAPWRGWLQTLDVVAPWLPDAAILQAVSMVQTRQEGIREKALEAMDRGVPIYTEGLKRLRDVLTLLIEQPDPDGRVAQSLDAVSRLAGRCNPQQVFTSLRLGA